MGADRCGVTSRDESFELRLVGLPFLDGLPELVRCSFAFGVGCSHRCVCFVDRLLVVGDDPLSLGISILRAFGCLELSFLGCQLCLGLFDAFTEVGLVRVFFEALLCPLELGFDGRDLLFNGGLEVRRSDVRKR